MGGTLGELGWLRGITYASCSRIDRVPMAIGCQRFANAHPVVAVTGLPIRVVTARGTVHASGVAMRRMWPIALSLVTLAACEHDVPSPPPVSSKKAAVAPTRGAAGDEDLRVMLSELASSKACGLVRGGTRQ